MSKKIIILNGSPRKSGNTSALTTEFSKGAEKPELQEAYELGKSIQ